MFFYWGLWFLFLLLALLWQVKYSEQGYRVLFVLVFLLAIIIGGREFVGSDWESYQTYYETGFAYDKVSGKMESLFGFVRNVCSFFGLSYGFFCFICSLLSLSILCLALKKMGVRNCFVAFLVYLSLFFCNYQFNIIRHGLLASFLFLGFSYLAEGKQLKAVICMLAGTGFHIMGLLFIPFVFFINKSISKKVAIIVVVGSFIVYFADLSGRIMDAFPFLAMIDRVGGYVDADLNESYKLSIGTIGFMVIAVYSICFRRDDYKNNSVFRITANMVLMGFIVFCALNAFSAIVQRVGNMLNLGVVFLLPYLWQGYKKKRVKLVVRCAVIAYLALYYPKSWDVQNEDGDYPMLPFKTEITNLF